MRLRVMLRGLVAAGLLGLASQQAYRHGYEYVFPIRPVEVLPGGLYRGAWQHDLPMRRLVREHRIKTIVALAHPDDHHMAISERELARELGVEWVHVPIIDDPKIGHGKTVTELLDQAADLLADPRRRPLYFHCHHGLIRTSMAQMAWRTKHCGWTLERAADEVSRYFGRESLPRGDDFRRVEAFYRECVPAGRNERGAPSLSARPEVPRPAVR